MSSANILNPTGGVNSWRLGLQWNPLESEQLLEFILSSENLKRAFKQVKSNKGAAGVDGVKIGDFRDWVRPHWKSVKEQLFAGTYRPTPVKRVEIPKPDGGVRKLGIPTVLDRVIQQAIAQIMSAGIDPTFSEYSYGFRPQRSAHQAVRQVREYALQGNSWAVDVDLEKFFDKVDHDLLMQKLSNRIRDKRVLALIGTYLRSGVMLKNKTLEATVEGVPQGGPLSPLLANIMLDDLDRELNKRGLRFVRYADDFIILLKSKRAGERVLKSITRYLGKKLKLKVNEKKSKVVPVKDAAFLGFVFRRKKIIWSEKSYQNFRREIRRLTSRTWGVSMAYRLKKFRQYVRGWMGYYGISELYGPLDNIDNWIRRRIRMCFLKMWGRPRTMMRELIRRGCSIKTAVGLGRSSKSWARKSKNPTINSAINNKYLEQIGLTSVKGLWVKIHYP